MSGLRLRPVREGDEAVVRAAQEEMAAEDFVFALWLAPGQPWPSYVESLARWRRGLDLPDGTVASTFLLAEDDGQVVGRTSVRHELTEWLALEGGHIGYGVLPAHRRRGHATKILRQSLVVAGPGCRPRPGHL